MSPRIRLHPTVAAALESGAPVVALESAVITHGLPREPIPIEQLPASLRAAWTIETPANLELARQLIRIVAEHGATPALIAVLDGELRIGLDDDELDRLARRPHVVKVSARDLAPVMARGGSGGVTVAAALLGCTRAAPRPIRVFATGGIGGVHRGWTERPDVSNDLAMLARSPVCVVSAGAKSILDLPATLEALDTLGVPVIGLGVDHFPRFVCPPPDDDAALSLAHAIPADHADIPGALAEICRTHWHTLGQRSAVLAVQGVDPDEAVDPGLYADAVAEAEWEADRAQARGAARTPFLLQRLAELTKGRAPRANLALLAANARAAARIAVALAE